MKELTIKVPAVKSPFYQASQVIPIGLARENGSTRIRFDISLVRRLYGDGAAEVVVQRPGEASPYPAYSEMTTSDIVDWYVSAADCEKIGSGGVELWYTYGSNRAKYAWKTYVYEAFKAPSDVPAPMQGWVEKILKVAEEIKLGGVDSETLKRNIEEAITKYLSEHDFLTEDDAIDIAQNVLLDYWETHKDELKGEKGDQGERGPQGIQGPQGPQGPIGQTGPQGERGLDGAQGERGPEGPKGADGTMTFEDLTPEQKLSLKGDKGDKGDTGATGPQGPKGDKGDTGAAGPKGDPGEITRIENPYDDTEIKESLTHLANGKVGYAEVSGTSLKMYADNTKANLIATLTLPSGSSGGLTEQQVKNIIESYNYITEDTDTTYTFRVSDSKLYVKPSNAPEYSIDLPSGNNGSIADEVQKATIYDMPKRLVEQPILGTIRYVNPSNDLSKCIVKPAVCSYGGHYGFVFTENIDGGTDDLPTPNGSGVTSVKARYLWKYSETNFQTDETKTIAQKGSSYTSVDGTTKTMGGGVGYSSITDTNSGYEAIAYFSFVDNENDGATVNGSYVYHLHPCCASFNFNNGTIGEIKELSLTVDGVKGKFDLTRLGYENLHTYYTTVAPLKKDGTYYWSQPVTDGVEVFTSTNGVDWVRIGKVNTSFAPYFEAPIHVIDTYSAYIACRSWYSEKKLYVLNINLRTLEVKNVYWIDDVGSRPSFVTWGGNTYLLHSTPSRYSMEMLLIKPDDYGLGFQRWINLYGTMTYYPVAHCRNSYSKTTGFVLCGLNGVHTDLKGMSWVEVELENFDGARYIESSNGLDVPISPIMKTTEMKNEVGVDEHGRLWTGGSSSEGGSSPEFSLIANEDITSGSTSHRIDLSKSYNHFVIFGSVVSSSNTNLNVSCSGPWGYADKRVASLSNGVNTNGGKRFSIEIEKIDTKLWKVSFSSNLEGYQAQGLSAVAIGGVMNGVDDATYFEFVSSSNGQAFTGGNIKIYAK